MADAQPAGTTIIVDEVQRVPAMLSAVHAVLERRKDIRFVLTGSSARKLKRAGVDLLAGRALLKRFHPFMASELGGSFSLDRALSLGLLPLVLGAEDPERTLRSYVSLYMQEEVRAEGLVRNLGNFARFLQSISLSHGAELNTSAVARDCEVSRKTVEGYIEICADLLLSYRLPVFQKRVQRKTVHHDKFYFFDAGVFRSLRPAGPLDRPGAIDGAALEGLVGQHLRAYIDCRDDGHEMFFWRTTSGTEVDFIVYGPETFFAIEAKKSARVRPEDLRGLRAFREEYAECTPILLYAGSERLMLDGLVALPCTEFLRALSPSRTLAECVG